jgi:hypothetical protein
MSPPIRCRPAPQRRVPARRFRLRVLGIKEPEKPELKLELCIDRRRHSTMLSRHTEGLGAPAALGEVGTGPCPQVGRSRTHGGGLDDVWARLGRLSQNTKHCGYGR